jgi:hypothetical protein
MCQGKPPNANRNREGSTRPAYLQVFPKAHLYSSPSRSLHNDQVGYRTKTVKFPAKVLDMARALEAFALWGMMLSTGSKRSTIGTFAAAQTRSSPSGRRADRESARVPARDK